MILLEICSPIWHQRDPSTICTGRRAAPRPGRPSWWSRQRSGPGRRPSRSRSWRSGSRAWGRTSRPRPRTCSRPSRAPACAWNSRAPVCLAIARGYRHRTNREEKALSRLDHAVVRKVINQSCTCVMSWRPDSISTWKPSVPITDAKTIMPYNKCQIIQFAGNKSQTLWMIQEFRTKLLCKTQSDEKEMLRQ